MNSSLDHLNRYIAQVGDWSWRMDPSRGCFELVSGTWKGHVWRHDVVVVEPTAGSDKSADRTAILYITGGDVNPRDIEEAQALADRSGIEVAMLFHIPNQPLFDKWEDDLIAHTFEEYIDSGDASWPLLNPMVRAAVRSMDMLEKQGFRQFVVMGASKRGWTTWLAGATGDPRIIGIAPMVIDNLNFPAQMDHQIETWGAYSEQIEDYTSRELQSEMDSERGAELVLMMDPINYIDRIACPILIVNGGNDRYWTVDALSLYWDLLPASTRCLIVPNVGHVLGDKVQMIESVGAFARACATNSLLPRLAATCQLDGSTLTASIEADGAAMVRLWAVCSDSLDFRDSEWRVLHQSPEFTGKLTGSNCAVLWEARYPSSLGEYSLSTPAKVLTPP